LGEIANPPEPTGEAASALGRYVREGPDYVPGEAPEKQFRTPVHCVHLSKDGLVCLRPAQFRSSPGREIPQGFLVHRETRDNGSAWTLSFSHDSGQKYLLVGDGINQRIWVLRRSDGAEASNFGAGICLYRLNPARWCSDIQIVAAPKFDASAPSLRRKTQMR